MAPVVCGVRVQCIYIYIKRGEWNRKRIEHNRGKHQRTRYKPSIVTVPTRSSPRGPSIPSTAAQRYSHAAVRSRPAYSNMATIFIYASQQRPQATTRDCKAHVQMLTFRPHPLGCERRHLRPRIVEPVLLEPVGYHGEPCAAPVPLLIWTLSGKALQPHLTKLLCEARPQPRKLWAVAGCGAGVQQKGDCGDASHLGDHRVEEGE